MKIELCVWFKLVLCGDFGGFFKAETKASFEVACKMFVGKNMSRYLLLIYLCQKCRIILFILIFRLIGIACLKMASQAAL